MLYAEYYYTTATITTTTTNFGFCLTSLFFQRSLRLVPVHSMKVLQRKRFLQALLSCNQQCKRTEGNCILCVTLSGLAGFTGAKDNGLEVVVTTGVIRRAKLQSNYHHQQTNTQLFTGRMPFLPLYKQCPSTERKYSSQPVTTNSYHNKYGLTMNARPDNDRLNIIHRRKWWTK